MKAAIFRGGDIIVDTLPEPVPATGQALVKVLACGICGSDLHAARHSHRMVEVSRRIPGRIPMDLDRDVVMGHEFCCELIDYGPRTEKKLKPGTRVCAMPVMLEPDGPKGMGYSNTYVGGYAEQMLLAAPLTGQAVDIRLTTPLGSAAYVDITLQTLARFGVRAERQADVLHVPGAQRYRSPGSVEAVTATV